MAITAEIEVLRQQLKGKGMYTVPPALPSTSNIKPSHNVHFQPIDPAHKSPVQAMDQSLLNSTLNLLDDSSRPQSSSSNGSMPCGQTTPQGSVHASNSPMHIPLPRAPQPNVPPAPYVNQTAVNQHMGTQPAPIPPRSSTGPTNLQPPANMFPPQVPSNIQPQPLPFINAPPAPTQDSFVISTASPSSLDTRSKSKNGQGVKQTSSTSSSASTSTDKSGPICWNCGEAGHLKRNCPNPPHCSKCKEKGHLPVKCPLKGKRKEASQTPQRSQQAPVDQRFSNIRNKCIHCGGDHAPGMCPTRTQPQAAPSTVSYMAYKGNTGAGKINDNVSAPYSTKNSQSIAGSMTTTPLVNNPTGTQGRASGNHAPQVTPQFGPNVPQQQNSYIHNNTPPMQIPNQFPPPPYFPIPFPPPPIAPSNVSTAPSAPASDLSAAITLMMNAVTRGNSNTTAITDALQRTTTQFADALQQTIQMGADAQAQEIKNARLDKQFDKVKVFDGFKPSECHPWLEEVHALCIQTGRPFCKMLLLCAGQAVRD